MCGVAYDTSSTAVIGSVSATDCFVFVHEVGARKDNLICVTQAGVSN